MNNVFCKINFKLFLVLICALIFTTGSSLLAQINKDEKPTQTDTKKAKVQLKVPINISVGFAVEKDTIQRAFKKKSSRMYELNLTGLIPGQSYKLSVKPDFSKATILQKDFSITLAANEFVASSEESKMHLVLHIAKDSVPTKRQYLSLEVSAKLKGQDKSLENLSQKSKLKIQLEPSDHRMRDRYLIHLGTNFDLVDGLQPKKLSFAANIFLPNDKAENQIATGAYFSIYGNRSVSILDTQKTVTRTVRFEFIDTTNQRIEHVSSFDVKRALNIDNLGAQLSFAVNLGKLSENTRETRWWLLPTTEFIWRRFKSTEEYTNALPNRVDTVAFDQSGSSYSTLDFTPRTISTEFSQFEWNYGLGFLMEHRTNLASVRFHFAIGANHQYGPVANKGSELQPRFDKLGTNIFFSGKLWIREPVSGLTLNAEVFNRTKDYLPYFNVTLSKAFDLNKLGAFFKETWLK